MSAQPHPFNDDEVFICFEGKYHADQVELGGCFYRQMSELVKTQPGFISQTAFVSIDHFLQRLLYVRFASEEHLHNWRKNHMHRGAQAKGRASIFADYRLRVGKEALTEQPRGPEQNTSSPSKYLLLWQYPKSTHTTSDDQSIRIRDFAVDIPPVIRNEVVDSAVYQNASHILRVSAWPSEEVGQLAKAAIPRIEGDDLQLIRVERDYGKFWRDEAPVDAETG